MGINDFIKRSSDIDVVTNNIVNVANECKIHGIKNIFVVGLTVNNRPHSNFINAVNNTLKIDCIKYGYENGNILPDNLWQDGLH